MLTVKIVEGPEYYPTRKAYLYAEGRSDYIRFEWTGGYLQMQKAKWDKLPLRKKQLIYSKGRE